MNKLIPAAGDNTPADYNIKVTVRNGRLLSRMRTAGYPTVMDFCRKHGLAQSVVQGLINLKMSGLTKSDRWRKSVIVVSDILQCVPEDIIPPQHWRKALTKSSAEIEVTAEQAALLVGEDAAPDAGLINEEMREMLIKMLRELSPREERVLRLRYGIDCEQLSLEECTELFGVTRERIRQIELKALRRLKHPSRSHRLQPYLYK